MTKSFKELTETQEGGVLLVDSFNLGFRWLHKGSTDFLDEYVETIESLKRSYRCSTVILACDWGSSEYRKNILPSYKANRKEKQELQTEEDRLKFERFYKEYERVLLHYQTNTNYPVFRFSKTEADDIAAYIVKYRSKFNLSNIWLVSSDKDWDLLVACDVSRFSYVTRKEITLENWEDHYEYTQEEHISIKCLQGDSGDNVPGVPGIGPKKAHQLVQLYGTTYDIIANLPIQSKYKYVQNLNEFGADRLLLNYRLMDLLEFCDEAIGEANCAVINARLLKE